MGGGADVADVGQYFGWGGAGRSGVEGCGTLNSRKTTADPRHHVLSPPQSGVTEERLLVTVLGPAGDGGGRAGGRWRVGGYRRMGGQCVARGGEGKGRRGLLGTGCSSLPFISCC